MGFTSIAGYQNSFQHLNVAFYKSINKSMESQMSNKAFAEVKCNEIYLDLGHRNVIKHLHFARIFTFTPQHRNIALFTPLH